MTGFAHATLVGWLVLGVILFRFVPAQRAVVVGYVLGVLFLPELRTSGYLAGIPDPIPLLVFKLTKTNAIAVGLLVGSLLFDRKRWADVRPRWFDLPILAWCLSPAVTSLGNTIFYDDPVSRFDPEFLPASAGQFGRMVSWLEYGGLYDGLAQALDTGLSWGVPYWLGRLYLASREGLQEVCLWAVGGAVLYIPFCLAETRLSPQLHRWVYGFHQHDFLQSIRFGGYRPMVFMEHGLAVGLWMVLAAVAAFWLWWAGPLRSIPVPGTGSRVSGLWVAIPLVATAVACKSTGALVLGSIGLAALALARLTRWALPVAVLICAAPLYAVVRTEGSWDGQEVVDAVAQHIDEDRAASLAFRLSNENMLVEKALKRPVIGWGGWGRARVYNPDGEDITVTDGLWVITLGERGLGGLVCLGLLILLPVARFLARFPARTWADPEVAPAAAAALMLALYSIDSLMNAMLNPVFMLFAGALTALPTNVPDLLPGPAIRPRSWRVRRNQVEKRILTAARAAERMPAVRGRVRSSREGTKPDVVA